MKIPTIVISNILSIVLTRRALSREHTSATLHVCFNVHHSVLTRAWMSQDLYGQMLSIPSCHMISNVT